MKKEENNKKMNLKERLKDKRERAKIELIIYGIFFIGVIIFARVLGSQSVNIETDNNSNQSFISAIDDNYEYTIIVSINNNIHEYYGKVLGNNKSITLKNNDKTNNYYYMNEKYYALEEGNYILTNEDEIYPYINSRYLNTSTIKEYLKIATKENNTYTIYLKDILLNSESEEYITITIEEGDFNIVIDYTSLLKTTDQNIERAVVNITYSNINKIISLEE